MRGITDALIEDPENRFCKQVIECGISPVIDLCDDVPTDVIEHFKYKCNDNFGHLDYRPPEIMDDLPGTMEAWETYKEKTQIKAWPSYITNIQNNSCMDMCWPGKLM